MTYAILGAKRQNSKDEEEKNYNSNCVICFEGTDL